VPRKGKSSAGTSNILECYKELLPSFYWKIVLQKCRLVPPPREEFYGIVDARSFTIHNSQLHTGTIQAPVKGEMEPKAIVAAMSLGSRDVRLAYPKVSVVLTNGYR
jgi:hypothetical protein